ncbi:MAG: DUF882 domain-containing protein [Mesorhizobium sp.]|uniref:DUF882 domain-containing protein n=1 Tax=Mesorhizobium sp. TaxID=1871066 RepID=UPI000FE52211|nr:DUF882 domain-containing protein [Mesorhizobium sp.]RWA75424.1 MAG: DUF882 domain-containing protein [Mesorhizobium sp.]
MSVWPRWLAAVILAIGFLSAAASGARAEIRSLKLYHLHTGEKAEIVYKRNGRYDPVGLRKINIILRDWRRNEPTKMDPHLLDLVWEAYRESGATDYIQVVCGYRSPATNSMLRSRSRGVAKESQHMLGKALDFYIPGVPLKKLRNIGLKMQGGGVGYYPRSGSPFVHMDVGNVRHWPGISRQELVSLFPNGKTLHVPSDGRPLPGYEQAMAAYKSRKGAGSPNIELASAGGSTKRSGGLLAAWFGGGDEADDSADVASAQPAPQPKAVKQAAKSSNVPGIAVAAPQDAKRTNIPQIADDSSDDSQPQQDTPEMIIAALPAKEIPLPASAPRSNVDVSQQAPGTADAESTTKEPIIAAPVSENAAAAQLAFDSVPLPSLRPDGSHPAPAHNNGLQALAETAAYHPATADMLPTGALIHSDEPKAAFEKSGATGGDYQVASLAQTFKDPSGAASPRDAIAARPAGSDPALAIGAGVKTMGKESRATANDPEHSHKAVVLAAAPQAARWALTSGENITTVSTGTTAPRYAYNIVHTPPSEVYTDGFQLDKAMADPNRFTGNAVRFLSVARFQTK